MDWYGLGKVKTHKGVWIDMSKVKCRHIRGYGLVWQGSVDT